MIKTLILNSKDIYKKGIIKSLWYDRDKNGIVLYDSVLIENDASGCGYPYEKDILKDNVKIKKIFYLNNPLSHVSYLLIYHTVRKDGKTKPYIAPALVSINKIIIKTKLKVGWNYIKIRPDYLKKGSNEIIISNLKGNLPIIPIADKNSILKNTKEYKIQTSFKSNDNGKKWSNLLGMNDNTEGEYMIRLHLRQYVKKGVYESNIIDLGDMREKDIIKQQVDIDYFSLKIDLCRTMKNREIEMSVKLFN